MLRGNVQKGAADLHLLVVAGLVFPGTGTEAATGTETASATRGDTAFGQAMEGFPEDARSARHLELAT